MNEKHWTHSVYRCSHVDSRIKFFYREFNQSDLNSNINFLWNLLYMPRDNEVKVGDWYRQCPVPDLYRNDEFSTDSRQRDKCYMNPFKMLSSGTNKIMKLTKRRQYRYETTRRTTANNDLYDSMVWISLLNFHRVAVAIRLLVQRDTSSIVRAHVY